MNKEKYEITSAPTNEFSATNVLARMVDSIILGHHLAAEGLTEKEVGFRPVEGSMNMEESLIRIHGMSLFTLRFLSQTQTLKKEVPSYTDFMEQSLDYYTTLSQYLKNASDQDLENSSQTNPRTGFEFTAWHFIICPLADCLKHIGQIISWRRISGNPQLPIANFFEGVRVN